VEIYFAFPFVTHSVLFDLVLKVFLISFNVCHLFYYCQSINGGRICCVTPISVDLLLNMNL
jgi:hypothetical protein